MKFILGLLLGIGVGVGGTVYLWYANLATSEEQALLWGIIGDYFPSLVEGMSQ